MEHIAISIVSWLVGVLLGQYGRDIVLILTGWLNRDIPNLHGKWLALGISEDRQFSENIVVTQIGRLIFGEIRSNESNHVYKFRGRIVRNAIFGNFYLVGHRRATGIGAFQLISDAEDRELIGKSLWHDSRDDNIVTTDYVWFRSESEGWIKWGGVALEGRLSDRAREKLKMNW
jgi:hypothetical protein